MGGPIGVMSPHFMLKAGLLLISVRVDTLPVTAVLDPSSPESVIEPRVIEKVEKAFEPGPAKLRKDHSIGIDHAEVSFRRIAVGVPPGGASLSIGADLLSEIIIEFDFSRSRLKVLDHSVNSKVGRGMTAVPFEMEAAKCLTLPGVDEHGTAVRVALLSDEQASLAPAERHQIGIGQTKVDAMTRSVSNCPASTLAMDWSGFGRSRVLLDMTHHRMWLSPADVH